MKRLRLEAESDFRWARGSLAVVAVPEERAQPAEWRRVRAQPAEGL